MLQRHEYLSGSTKVDRDWWIVTKLVALTVICALISAGVFWLLEAGKAPSRWGSGTPISSGSGVRKRFSSRGQHA